MDLQCPSFQVLFTFLLLTVILLLKIGKRGHNNNSSASNLPPGPWKLPIIGNIHQLIGTLPHRGLRDLAKKYGPVMHLRLGEVSTIVVSSAELAKEVMKTHDIIFASRPQVLVTRILYYDSKDIAFAPYGDYWRELRKICTQELLSAKRVQSYRPIREKEVLNLIKWIGSRAGLPINLTQKVLSATYSITSQAAFGIQCKDQEEFIYAVKDIIKAVSGFNVADVFPSFKLLHRISGVHPKLQRLQKQADRILENIIKEHIQATTTAKSDEAQDLVDVLLKFHETCGGSELSLTTDNIKAVILDIFTAGSETSATTVDWTMSEMIKNPRIMKKAQDEVREVFNRTQQVNETSIREMKYLKLVIQEALRLHPPAPLLLPRECGERCEIDGYEIPVKTKVIVNAWAIGRDPNYWSEPETFNPERFIDSSGEYQGTNFDYIPFGAGRRMCPGILYGLANVELPLAMLLYHFDWSLPNGMNNEDLEMTEEFVLKVGKRCQNNNSTASNLPPGPWKLPIIGNIHQLIGAPPHRRLRDLAKQHGPLMHLKLGEVSTVVVSSAKFAKEVMKTHDIIFASRPQVIAPRIMAYDSTNIAFAPYGDYWRKLRKICVQELLSAKRVQSYRPIREKEVLNLIKWIGSRAGSPINLTQKVASSIYSITTQAAFGNQCNNDQEVFKYVMKVSNKAASGFNVADVFPSYKLLHVISGVQPKLETLQKETDRILENIIKEHTQATATAKSDEAEVQEDLVDVLLKFNVDHYGGRELSLTTDNIKAVILDVFIGGSESSAATINWTMSEMIKNPRIMKKAQDEVREVFNRTQQVNETSIREMKYLKLVIQEALRLHPPGPLLLPRECGERCEIDGYEIPVKTKVIVNAWAIGRDPNYWSEAETFNPERFIDSSGDYQGTNFDYIPFGAGRRICPGILFGLANVELPLAMLLYHFDWKSPME
uniref:cytochrome P450 71D9-like n=1 Tax=Fragaria vesca subsp. vesca TaxID=101020 RepID=UPI0005CA719A|nr:PREDICTED: cytochrome P450 71D9-like [Fragaria vesca subsp. vesca]